MEEILDKTHGSYQLVNRLNWDYLVNAYSPCYSENKGRLGIPIWVIAGLHYLKYLELVHSLKLSWRLLNQQKNDKKKLYSLHVPEVECIAKGKAHKKYEFGTKVSIATTCKDPWVVAIEVVHGNFMMDTP